MKYMLLIYSGEGCMTEAERTACMVESVRVCDDLRARGQFLDAAPLHPVATAKTVRVRDGKTLVTDGPFAETTEQLGGYYVLDLPDLDAAIAVACRLPPVHKGTVEIRPLLTLDGLPPGRPHDAEPGDPPYLLLIYQPPGTGCAGGGTDHTEGAAKAVAYSRQLAAEGTYLDASPLHAAATATSVRVRDGKRFITDGPFAETNEVLGGFFLVRAPSRAAAVDVALRMPRSAPGSIEVRQLFDLSGVRKLAASS
jgi:hypothetical protein